MKRTSFNDGWQYREKVNPFAELAGISAPYNESPCRMMPRSAATATPTVIERSRSTQPAPTSTARASWCRASSKGSGSSLELDGAYRDAVVFLNGDFVGQRPYGYTPFVLDADDHLRTGETNTLRVEVRAHDDSRWYTGTGITAAPRCWCTNWCTSHHYGVRLTTPDIDEERAVVETA